MKYTKQERADIGRRIYEGELSRSEAMEVYDISAFCARDYMRLYRNCNHLPPKEQEHRMPSGNWVPRNMGAPDLEDYESMTKEELIRELVKARITEARLKKGYEVKGVGADKEYIRLGNKNTK